MRSRRLPLSVVGVLLALTVGAVVAVLVLALRERPVEVRAAPSAGDPACAMLAARLPATVAGQQRRATSSGSPGVAAWGNPAIIWLCGVSEPGPSPDCIDVSGVDWVYERLDDGAAFTTYGRAPAAQVLVPAAYSPEPLRLPDFSAVVAAIPQGARRCT